MKTKSCKAKGRRLQNWMAEQISKFVGIPCGKDTEIVGREMGQSGVDVRMSKRVKELFPFSVEAKNSEIVNFWKSIEQAKSNQQPNTNWLLVCKRNREAPVVTMDAKVFFELLGKVG